MTTIAEKIKERTSVPRGWQGLVAEAIRQLPLGFVIESIKERNGELVIMGDGADRDYRKYLVDLRKRSRVTCMGCGEKGIMRVYGGRVWILCFDCYKDMLLEDQRVSVLDQ